MATPPPFVAEYESVWNTTTTPKTVDVTVTSGDILVVCGMLESNGEALNTPTGGSLTYTARGSVTVASNVEFYMWTAPCTSTTTFTLSVAITSGSSGIKWGIDVIQFGANGGVGANPTPTTGSGGPSLGITTTGANSAIVCYAGDWGANDGTTRTWRTVNSITPTSGNALEQVYFRDSAAYTVYGAYWNDSGATGAKTVGLSAPSQTFVIGAVEILGTAGTTPNPRGPIVVPGSAAQRASSW